jgi:hypothetical protein
MKFVLLASKAKVKNNFILLLQHPLVGEGLGERLSV